MKESGNFDASAIVPSLQKVTRSPMPHFRSSSSVRVMNNVIVKHKLFSLRVQTSKHTYAAFDVLRPGVQFPNRAYPTFLPLITSEPFSLNIA